MNTELYPLLFEPVYKDYIWGGNRIAKTFDRDPEMETVAESWEISDRQEGMSIVSNGPLEGTTLHDLAADRSLELLGSATGIGEFPLLIKIIDASKRLSVQVHPNNKTAAQYGGEAKTEMWYVLKGTPDAKVFAGLKPGTTAESFRQALDNTSLEDVLVSIPVKPHDVIFIPGGRVHAIAEGCLLLEVQQNSNTTYRVYDWGRMGKDGKPRDLHIEQAFQVINWDDTDEAITTQGPAFETETSIYRDVLKCDYFHLKKIDLKETEEITHDGSSFHTLFILSGKMKVTGNSVSVEITPGTSCLVPACIDSFYLEPMEENTSAIITSIPQT